MNKSLKGLNLFLIFLVLAVHVLPVNYCSGSSELFLFECPSLSFLDCNSCSGESGEDSEPKTTIIEKSVQSPNCCFQEKQLESSYVAQLVENELKALYVSTPATIPRANQLAAITVFNSPLVFINSPPLYIVHQSFLC